MNLENTVDDNVDIVHDNKWITLIDNNKYKIWILGFIVRLIASATNLEAYDYIKYRIPISKDLNDGLGLYSDLEYNQMPVYPYLSALMYNLFGDQNDILTAIILRFPITVADSMIPIVLYYLGIEFGKRKEGIQVSFLYVINPLSLIEVSVATFHPIGNLFLLLSIYFLLQKRHFISGLFISLGFFTSEFPLIALGVTVVYLKDDLQPLLRSFLGFGITSLAILSFVLIPTNTSLNQMYNSLRRHPIYKGTIRGVVSELYRFLNDNFGLSEEIYYNVWLVLFLFIALLPLVLYLRNNTPSKMLDVLIIQMSILSLFFTANHTKHIFWLFPWLALWAFLQGGRMRVSILFLTITYLLRRVVQDYLNEFVWITTVFLGMIGIWVIRDAFRNLIIVIEPTQETANNVDVNL